MDDVTQVTVDHKQIEPLYSEIAEKLQHLDREELIKHFVSLQFNKEDAAKKERKTFSS